MVGRNHRCPIYLCLCDCGNTKEVPIEYLRNYHTQSCGCLKKVSSPENGKKNLRGKESPIYKHELTEEDRQLNRRLMPGTLLWRREVFDRYDNSCDICGFKGMGLVAHHLNSWAAYPELRFEVENGVALCPEHHNDFHWRFMGGYSKPCTKEDYSEYLEEHRKSTTT